MQLPIFVLTLLRFWIFIKKESDMLNAQRMNYRTLKDIDINKAKLNTKTCTGWLQYDLSWGMILSAGNTQFSHNIIFKCWNWKSSFVNKSKLFGIKRNRVSINGSLFSIVSVKLDCLKSFKKAYEFGARTDLLRASNITTKNQNQLHTN